MTPITIKASAATWLERSGRFSTANPAAAAEWHPTLNRGAGPSQVTPMNGQKAAWQCRSCGHVWVTEIKARHRTGCPSCSIAERGVAVRKGRLGAGQSLQAIHPELMEEWDADRNMDDPSLLSPQSNRKAHWVCKACRERWVCRVQSRTALGSGCPACSLGSRSRDVRSAYLAREDTESLLQVAAHDQWAAQLLHEWDPESNDLAPDEVTVGSKYKAGWVCPHGHRYHSTVDGRFRRRDGCMTCSKGRRVSRTELAALVEARHIWGVAHHQHKVDGYEVDVLVPSEWIAIEIDGYFHTYATSLGRDRRKTRALLQAGYRVYRLRHRDAEDLADGSCQAWGSEARLRPDEVIRLFKVIAMDRPGDGRLAAYASHGQRMRVAEGDQLWGEAQAVNGPSRIAPELNRALILQLQAAGMSQKEISRRHGVSQMVVSRRKRGV